MISPLATSRQSSSRTRRQNRQNEQNNRNDEDADLENQLRDQLMVDQLVDNPMAAAVNGVNRRRERSFCCGLFKRRRDGHMDIMCLKDMH